MPHISRVLIKNFRACKNLDLMLDLYTPIVGYNNAGKTAILDAILWAVEPKSLTDKDFNDHGAEVEVICWIDGVTDDVLAQLDEKHRGKYPPFVEDQRIVICTRQGKPNDSATSIQRLVLQPGQDPAVNESWKLNPSGIKETIKKIYPDTIRIQAMVDAAADVGTNKASSTFGKLLKLISDSLRADHGEELKAAVDNLRQLMAIDGGNRSPHLEKIDQAATDAIAEFFPGMMVKVHIPPPELDLMLKEGSIRVGEDGNLREIEQMGHGVQRTAQMALLRVLAEKQTARDNSTRALLLIDEPELYLHPQAIEIVRIALRKLADTGYQILFSTHSPSMVPSGHASITRIAYRDENGTCVRNTMKSSLDKLKQHGLDAAEDVLFCLDNSSQILFSEHIILAEGKTERLVLPKIYAEEKSKTLGADKVALVSLDGSGLTLKAMAILKYMGLRCKAVVDLDWPFNENNLSVKLNPELAAASKILTDRCKPIMIRLRDAGKINIGDNGLPSKKGPVSNVKAEDGWAIFSCDTEGAVISKEMHELCKQHEIWIWPSGSIEKHLELTGKKGEAAVAFACRLDKEGCAACIPSTSTVYEMLNWVTQV